MPKLDNSTSYYISTHKWTGFAIKPFDAFAHASSKNKQSDMPKPTNSTANSCPPTNTTKMTPPINTNPSHNKPSRINSPTTSETAPPPLNWNSPNNTPLKIKNSRMALNKITCSSSTSRPPRTTPMLSASSTPTITYSRTKSPNWAAFSTPRPQPPTPNPTQPSPSNSTATRRVKTTASSTSSPSPQMPIPTSPYPTTSISRKNWTPTSNNSRNNTKW